MWYTNAPSEVCCIGIYNVFVQVLALGKGESTSKERDGVGMNPRENYNDSVPCGRPVSIVRMRSDDWSKPAPVIERCLVKCRWMFSKINVNGCLANVDRCLAQTDV